MQLKNFTAGMIVGSLVIGGICTYHNRQMQREYVIGLNKIEYQTLEYSKLVSKQLEKNSISKYFQKDLETEISLEFLKLKKIINEEKIKYIEFE